MKLSLVLLLISSFANAAEPPKESCDLLMAKLLRVDSLSTQPGFAYGFDDSVLAPLEQVVNARRANGLTIPKLELTDIKSKHIHREWSLEQDELSRWVSKVEGKNLPQFGTAKDPLPLRQIGEASAPVYLVDIGGEQMIFRPAKTTSLPGALAGGVSPSSTGAARRTVAASVIDEQIGADVVAPSKVAKVNGVAGSLSRFIPNAQEVGVVQPQMYFVPGKEANWRNVQAMEFLLGNGWSHGHNQLRDSHLHTWAIDFDQAFMPGVPRALPKQKSAVVLDDIEVEKDAWLKDRQTKLAKAAQAFPFGTKLPERYSEDFISGLRAYTPAKIRQSLNLHLQPEEIEGVIFRREIILADAEGRGSEALLRESGKFKPSAVPARDSYAFAQIWPLANPMLSSGASKLSKAELRAASLAWSGIDPARPIGPMAKKIMAGLDPADVKHFSLEYLLHSSGISSAAAPLRAKVIAELGRSPRATGRTIELMTEISRGAKTAAKNETKLAAEAITSITERIGSYPPRLDTVVPKEDVRQSLLHQPFDTIDAMLPKDNVYRVKLKNGVRGILKPRMQDRPWMDGSFDPNRIAYTRELEAKLLLEKFMGNEAARKAGKSRIWIPETVEVSPVIKGKAYGPSSFQAFAEGYMPLDDFIKQNPDVWRVLVRSPEWKDTKARIKVLDYAQGNLDRLGNKANTAHFLRKLNLANIMVPKDLRNPANLQVALIDNAIGRPGIPHFTIQFAGKVEEIPADVKAVLKDFDFDGYAAHASQYLNAEGAADTIKRVQELRRHVGVAE